MTPEEKLIAKVEAHAQEIILDIGALSAAGVPMQRVLRIMQAYIEPMRTIVAELRGPDLEYRSRAGANVIGIAGPPMGGGNPMSEIVAMMEPIANAGKQQGLAAALRAAHDTGDTVLEAGIRERMAEAFGLELEPRTVEASSIVLLAEDDPAESTVCALCRGVHWIVDVGTNCSDPCPQCNPNADDLP